MLRWYIAHAQRTFLADRSTRLAVRRESVSVLLSLSYNYHGIVHVSLPASSLFGHITHITRYISYGLRWIVAPTMGSGLREGRTRSLLPEEA